MDVSDVSELLSVDIEEVGDDEDILVIHMDIREPLSTLRSLLENETGLDLSEYTFTLQESQTLENDKNLVDQCVQGEGFVQINVKLNYELSTKTIDIVDVLKPADEEPDEVHSFQDDDNDENLDNKSVKWVSDPGYREDQMRLQIPTDPLAWEKAHVRHWILWAVRQFNLSNVNLLDWMISGRELCSLSKEELYKKVPNDPDGVFWIHFSILRKCKVVAVLKTVGGANNVNEIHDVPSVSCKRKFEVPEGFIDIPKEYEPPEKYSKFDLNPSVRNPTSSIHLWQFLLELLTDKRHLKSICWLGNEGEFCILNPEHVAKLWGERKNKPAMNYEKLSRALRYYYDGEMLSKVPGKKFVYKYICDLKFLVGFSPKELRKMVSEADEDSED